MKSINQKIRTMQSLMNDISKNKYDFNHPVQRKSNQWTLKQKQLLIISALINDVIPPILFSEHSGDTKADNIIYVIDGKQRLEALYQFYTDEFKVPKGTPSIFIGDVEYIVEKKKFSKLDDEVKLLFTGREIPTTILMNPTMDEEVRNFKNVNSGKALSSTQLRTTIESDELREIISNLEKHEFFEKNLSDNLKKNDFAKECIRQTLMFTEDDKNYSVKSFSSSNVNKFLVYYNECLSSKGEDSRNKRLNKIAEVEKALDILSSSFDKLEVNKLSMPLVIYGVYYCIHNNRSVGDYLKWIEWFAGAYDTLDEYKKYCQDATARQQNVKGRFDFFKAELKKINKVNDDQLEGQMNLPI